MLSFNTLSSPESSMTMNRKPKATKETKQDNSRAAEAKPETP